MLFLKPETKQTLGGFFHVLHHTSYKGNSELIYPGMLPVKMATRSTGTDVVDVLGEITRWPSRLYAQKPKDQLAHWPLTM